MIIEPILEVCVNVLHKRFYQIMGHGFGELIKLRRIITVSISPFEQRAFANVLTKGVTNTLRRFRESVFYVAPPLVTAYIVYDQVEKEHARLNRKNPKDYENDV